MSKTIDKPILDVTCGSRMIWFNKQHLRALYIDNRTVPKITLCDGRSFEVNPDVVTDFRHLPYPDGTFKLVVFDPPHDKSPGKTSWTMMKYGKLPDEWKSMLKDGVRECMRVLDDYGVLIFKWSEIQISTRAVIDAIGIQPLFGHRIGKQSKTHWMTFMKIPEMEEIKDAKV